jgi:hypothetical protein
LLRCTTGKKGLITKPRVCFVEQNRVDSNTLEKSLSLACSYNEGTISHRPSIATWNIILGAWSRSSDPQAASKAETVLKRMHELYDTGILDERPNGISYTTCLCCWVASRSKDRSNRVEALLDRMDALKDSGDKLIYKDMYDYTLTIRVLCRMKNDKLTTRAEFLMRRMLKEFCRSHPK